MKTLHLCALAVLCCLGFSVSLYAQNSAADRGSITLKDDKGHEVKLIPQLSAPMGSWVFEIPYLLPSGAGGHQTPQANPLGNEPYITFATGSTDLSNNRVLSAGSGLSLTVGGSDNANATIANTGVLSLSGTTNQVNASASTGAVTLSLPQDIHTGASPTFTNASLTAIPTGSAFSNIVVSNGGALQTRTIASLAKADGSEPLLTFSAGGSSLTNNRVLSPGFGIAFTDVGTDDGAFSIENSGVLSAIGTTNQINVSSATGNVTFSLPQNIHSGATPTFSGMTLSSLAGSSTSGDIVVSNAGVLETRSLMSLGKADASEPLVTFGPGSAALSNNRILTAGTGIAITDGGSDNGPITVSVTTTGWALTGNNFAPGEFLGGDAGNTNSLDLRTNNTTRLLLNDDASIQRDASGDARGIFASDMQAYRSVSNQVASGMLATISGGGDNRASGFLGATVGGGVGNVASGFYYSVVAGGNNNTASNSYATISGGKSNLASGAGSFIGGGGYDGSSTAGNVASGPATTISGGYNNNATVDFATVGGGSSNLATNYAATIAGGESNQATDYGTAVGGGVQNYALEFLTTVSGGGGNTAGNEIATVGGGLSNTASGFVSTVGGGQLNNATGDSTTIGGGSYNRTSGRNSTIGGGSSNRASALYATVAGGHFNTASGSERSTVGGGGGNTASGNFSTVSGGYNNTANSVNATVAGGQSNTAGDGASVSGGVINQATGIQSAIGGGANNTASGASSNIGGGTFNTSNGVFSSIVGGTQNSAGGERSTAMGFQASASRYGQVSHASGRFATTGDAQGSLIVLRNSTSDSTTSELFLDGTALRFTISDNSAVTFSILVVGRSSAGESAGYEIHGIIERSSGTTSLIGTPTKTVLGEDDAAWDVNVAADDTNDVLRISASGNTSDNIRWVATMRTSEVIY